MDGWMDSRTNNDVWGEGEMWVWMDGRMIERRMGDGWMMETWMGDGWMDGGTNNDVWREGGLGGWMGR